MINFISMSWSNMFSYGLEANTFNFIDNKIVQLVGKNGNGKSSIALILEEILFNKNSKGIKKSDIPNRHTDSDKYSASLTFEKDGDLYVIELERKSKIQKVSLTKNGEDISAHTATNTYKTISEILGMDHKTFTQIVYQSSSSSLEFLRSADTARKTFLIDLLNLNKYIKIGTYFKQVSSEQKRYLTELQSKVDTIKVWLDKHKNQDLDLKALKPWPTIDENISVKINELASILENITSRNAAITTNNGYKKILDSILIPNMVCEPPISNVDDLITERATHKKVIETSNALITKVKRLNDKCPTCEQQIDKELVDSLILENSINIKQATEKIEEINSLIKEVNAEIDDWKSYCNAKTEYETYYKLYNKELPNDVYSVEDIQKEYDALVLEFNKQKRDAAAIMEANDKITAHNAKVELILTQLTDMEKDYNRASEALAQEKSNEAVLGVLQKTFGTNGLVAYKIESLVYDLETASNEYLSNLTDGRFQIEFRITSSNDKLNVNIYDNGKAIDISPISTGEMSRINVSVLLAIRKIANSVLSRSRINLLFLDETIATLDTEGKEKLIECLRDEVGLNTVLVSHDYAHPLLDKIEVEKVNNISSIKKD